MWSNNQGWHVDHVCDGKFPWMTRKTSLHAVKDGKHFTQSAGLVAIHPVAEAPEYWHFYFVWLLGREAFLRFDYDPDTVLSDREGGRGSGGRGRTGIPGINLLDLRGRM